MHFLRRQLTNFWHSFTSLKFYSQVINFPLSQTFLYVFLITSVYSLITALIIGFTILLPIKQLMTVMPEKFTEFYPEELEISIKNGHVITNVEEPYYLPIERFTDFINTLENQIKGVTTARHTYFLIIDSQATAEDFIGLQTFILITDQNLIFYNDQGRPEMIPLSDLDGLTLNRQIITAFIQKLSPLFALIWPLLILIIFGLLLVFVPITLLSYCLLFSVLDTIFSRILKLPLKFVSVLQINLYLCLPLLIFISLLRYFSPGLSLSGLLSLFMLLSGPAVIIYLKEQSLPQNSPPVSPAV